MTYLTNLLLSFLSGAIFAYFFVGNHLPFSICMLTIGCALIPFLHVNISSRHILHSISYAIVFSVPIVAVIGEGLWYAIRYYYHNSLFSSVCIYLVWVWLCSSLHWIVISICLRFFKNHLWCIPVFWVSIEYLYAQVSLQARMVHLGLFLPQYHALTGFARFGGVYALTFLVVLINVIVFFLWKNIRAKRWFKGKSFLILSLCFILCFVIGKYTSLDRKEIKTNQILALLQPNSEDEFDHENEFEQDRINTLIEMSREALTHGADILVWPSSMINISHIHDVELIFKSLTDILQGTERILVGVIHLAHLNTGVVFLNSICLLNGNAKLMDRYTKRRLTPFTEYIPLSSFDFAGIRNILPYGTDQEKTNVIHDRHLIWSSPICVEIFYPELLSDYISKGAGHLIAFSNDVVYGTSKFPYFMLKIAVLRAMELGVPILRETTTGMNAVIDSDGIIQERLPYGMKGILYVKMNFLSKPSIYSMIGDVFSKLCLMILLGYFIYILRKKESIPLV